MILEVAPEIDRPQHEHYTQGSTDAQPVQAKQVADEELLQQLEKAGWEVTGDTAKNPATGTQISLGDHLTKTQADEINAALGASPAGAETAAPEGGGSHGGGSAPPSGGGSPAPAAEAAPPPASTEDVPPHQRYSKGDEIDQDFLNAAKAKGWNVAGDVATAPDGTKYKLGEHMTFNQAREANQAKIAKPAAAAPATV